MSETPLGSDEIPTPADLLNDALVRFTGCIGEALPDICSYGLTIGEAYVPFDPDEDDDCDEEEANCSQAWVRVASVTPQSVDAFGDGCASTMNIDLEVGIIRCIEIEEDGEAPTATQVLLAATKAMEDMNAIYCAAMNCDESGFASITAGEWTPDGPLGGQYGGVWTFTVEWI